MCPIIAPSMTLDTLRCEGIDGPVGVSVTLPGALTEAAAEWRWPPGHGPDGLDCQLTAVQRRNTIAAVAATGEDQVMVSPAHSSL